MITTEEIAIKVRQMLIDGMGITPTMQKIPTTKERTTPRRALL